MSFLYRIFLKGLLTLLPIMVTVYLLAWIIRSAENIFGEPLKQWLPYPVYFPGIGVVVVLSLIFIVGVLVNNYLTQKFFGWLEAQLERTPVIRSIYSPLRDVTKLFTNADPDQRAAQRVVFVKLEGLGVEALGLVTRDQFSDLPAGAISSREGNEQLAVFIPFSYGVGGFTVIVPKAHVRETAIPAEKAMQLAITGWIKATKP